MKVPDTKENRGKCICPNCPTHHNSNCMTEKGQNLFCAVGRSDCKIERKGCICGECPVASEYRLNELYFCDK